MLSACSMTDLSSVGDEAKIADVTQSQRLLASLPPAKQKVALSVYDFQDKTGQHKPNDAYAEYSRAVTQGGAAILYKALLDAGNHSWFKVIEREGLDNLLQERKIIRAMRSQYRRSDGSSMPDISPMLYAGVLLEGGIIAYESNILTGGLGARYLGIGGDTQYRRDVVTIYLRLVSVQSGEVLLSVNTSKTIYSVLLRGSVFKFIGIDELLEVESGFTVNEPPQFAVRQAIEMGVYSLVMEGAAQGLWSFADPLAGKLAMQDYLSRKQGKNVDLRNYSKLAQQMRQQKARQQAQRRAITPAADTANTTAANTVPVIPVISSNNQLPPPAMTTHRRTPVNKPADVSPAPPSPQPVSPPVIPGRQPPPPPPMITPPPEPQAPPSGAAAVQGQAQIPANTRYVPEADKPEQLERRRPQGNPAEGNGLYDYKVYCTKSGCQAVNPAP